MNSVDGNLRILVFKALVIDLVPSSLSCLETWRLHPMKQTGMWLANFEKEGIGRGVPGPPKELRRFSSIKYPKTPLRCPQNLQLTLVDFTKIYKF